MSLSMIKSVCMKHYKPYKRFSLISYRFIVFIFLMVKILHAQSDYLDAEHYKKFAIKRKLLSNWQINQLADSGALVVRLKSNKKAIDHLIKHHQIETAKRLQRSTDIENQYIVSAFIKYYKFSKLYFIYDYSSDSLRKNIRGNYFLNQDLQRDSNIVMKEKFYLIAERDYVVQSTIGFVPDTLADQQTERGAPFKSVAIVIKNKYGHQLKHPFPYYVKGTKITKYDTYVMKLNDHLTKFKQKNPRIPYPDYLKPYMY